ncbi:Zinc/iron permease, partial [Protomyces lactucae-debilis]
SYGAGSVPLYLNLSDQKIDGVSKCGTGVLISCALSIIIPEGVEIIYSSLLASSTGVLEGSEHEKHLDSSHHVGIALLAGYALMFLIEQLSSHKEESSQYIAVDNLHEIHSYQEQGLQVHKGHTKDTSTTSIGLNLHAIADGIALGASAQASFSVSLVVFFAMVLHKLPAAFGLTAVLLQSKLSKRTIRIHLAIFSVAAPVGAIVTNGLMSLLGNEGSDSSAYLTGLILVFSGGTFLFVAV